MADNPQTLAAISNAVAQTFPDKIARQVNRMSVKLSLLTITRGDGKNVSWDVESDGALVENFTDGAPVVNFGSDNPQPAILPWGMERSNFRVTNTAAAVAASGASPAQLHDLIGRNLFNSSGALASTLNGLLYTGAGTGTLIAGTKGAAISDTGVYAGIDRALGGNAFWKASVFDPGAPTALSLKMIRDDLAAIYTKSGRRPDLAFVSPTGLNVVKSLFDGNRQWFADVNTAGRGKVTLENSASVVIVDGCQFIEDKDAPAGEISYENSAEQEIVVLPQAVNFADPLGPADDGFNTLMLGFYAYELGRVGSDRRMSIEAHLQLKIERPNAFGRRLNVKLD
jgi:hypothetical protein